MFFDYIKGFEVVYEDCGLDYIIFKYGKIEEDRE